MNVRRAGFSSIAAGLVMTAFAAGPADAQAKLELTPFFTSYYAVAKVLNETSGTGEFSANQIAGPGIGGRLTYWTAGGIGIEGSGEYIFSGVRVISTDPNFTFDQSLKGSIITASGRVLYRLPRSNFHVLAGAGAVIRGGEVWEGTSNLTEVSGIVGFGARAAVTPRLAFDVRVEGYLYQFDAFKDLGVDSKFQTDVHVSVGIPLSLAR